MVRMAGTRCPENTKYATLNATAMLFCRHGRTFSSCPFAKGSLEGKLPTIWTDEKGEEERTREEKRREKKIREEKKIRRKKLQVREKVGKWRITVFFTTHT